jgi:hypothetical protein
MRNQQRKKRAAKKKAAKATARGRQSVPAQKTLTVDLAAEWSKPLFPPPSTPEERFAKAISEVAGTITARRQYAARTAD